MTKDHGALKVASTYLQTSCVAWGGVSVDTLETRPPVLVITAALVQMRACGRAGAPSVMGWLQLVGSSKLQVSFAKECYKRDKILQKRPIILSRLLIVTTPYLSWGALTLLQAHQTLPRNTRWCSEVRWWGFDSPLIFVTVENLDTRMAGVVCDLLGARVTVKKD